MHCGEAFDVDTDSIQSAGELDTGIWKAMGPISSYTLDVILKWVCMT